MFCVTNWSSLTKMIEPPGTAVECHCAGAAFVTKLHGIDMHVIFKADKQGTLALLTNALGGKRGAEVKAPLAASKLLRPLISSDMSFAEVDGENELDAASSFRSVLAKLAALLPAAAAKKSSAVGAPSTAVAASALLAGVAMIACAAAVRRLRGS